MASTHAYTTKANLSRLSRATTASKPNSYTSRVNVSRLTSVNAEAFVRNASLLSRLGGEEALSSTVRYFYGKAFNDPRIVKLFDAADAATLEAQIQKQISFVKVALGGGGTIDVRTTYAYLATLGITGVQFDAVVEGISATLRSQNVPPTVLDEVVAFCESLRASIVR